jgi:hypothetical protein
MADLSTTNAYTDVFTSGASGVAVQVGGTFSGTVSFQASVDGANFLPVLMMPANSTTAVTSSTTGNVFTATLNGIRVLRAKMTTYTSGTATVVGSVK